MGNTDLMDAKTEQLKIDDELPVCSSIGTTKVLWQELLMIAAPTFPFIHMDNVKNCFTFGAVTFQISLHEQHYLPFDR